MNKGILALIACLQTGCFHASDPVLASEYAIAVEICQGLGGLVSVKVSRFRASTALTAQCGNGAVVEQFFASSPPSATKTYYTLT